MLPLITPLLAFPFVLYLTPSGYLRFFSLTGLLFFTGWSWLEHEGSRIEEEAEILRKLRSAIIDKGNTDLSANGGKGKLTRVKSWRDLIGEEGENSNEGDFLLDECDQY